MRTPANGRAVNGRPANGHQPDRPPTGQFPAAPPPFAAGEVGYDDTRDAYQDGGPYQSAPAKPQDDPYRDYRSGRVAADGYRSAAATPGDAAPNGYPTGSYPTARYTGDGYQPLTAGERDIAGQGYSPAGEDAATQLFRPAAPQMPTWGPPPELDLDVRRPTTPPPPLRAPTRIQAPVPQRAGWQALGAPASPPAAPPPSAPKGPRLRVDWPNCKAHGLCHELLPEAVRLDEWGFPVVGKDALPAHVIDDARRAVIACPTLALRLVD